MPCYSFYISSKHHKGHKRYLFQIDHINPIMNIVNMVQTDLYGTPNENSSFHIQTPLDVSYTLKFVHPLECLKLDERSTRVYLNFQMQWKNRFGVIHLLNVLYNYK